jgi:hypothetical protein
VGRPYLRTIYLPDIDVKGRFSSRAAVGSIPLSLKGEGAGVRFANASAGTASCDNLVAHNYIAGNELSGATMHAHTLAAGQFEDLSGNQRASRSAVKGTGSKHPSLAAAWSS